MSDLSRPRVAFELEVRSSPQGPCWVDGEGHLPRFDFPGGADWLEAVETTCLEKLGFRPRWTEFVELVEVGNTGDNPWIGARFDVGVDERMVPPAPFRVP